MRKKEKNCRCCKELCANKQTQKIAKMFEKICILITFIQPEHFLNINFKKCLSYMWFIGNFRGNYS